MNQTELPVSRTASFVRLRPAGGFPRAPTPLSSKGAPRLRRRPPRHQALRMWTRPDRAPSPSQAEGRLHGPCGQGMDKCAALAHPLPTLGALASTFSPLLQQRFMEKAMAPAPAGSRITPSSQEIRLRNTPTNSRGVPTRECEKQHQGIYQWCMLPYSTSTTRLVASINSPKQR